MMEPEAPFSPLVADLISASLAMTHDVTSRLIDSLTEQLDTSQAELAAIRNGIDALLSGPYLPSPAAIEAALYPPKVQVDRYRQQGDW